MTSPTTPRGAAARRLRGHLLAALFVLGGAALAQSASAAAAAAGDGPVVIRLGAYEERADDVAWRFGVTLRGVAAQQGQPYTEELAAELWSLLPYYLDQRVQEVALAAEARRRGLTPDAAGLEATIERIKAGLAEGQQFADVVAGAGFPSEAALRAMIEESDLIRQLLDQVREAAASEVTDDQVVVRYLAERARFAEPEKYCARHILVADEAVATDLLTRLTGGEEFAALAAEFGTDGTKSRGGDLGCFGLGAMVPEFEAAVVAAPLGTGVGPVATQFGYHVVLVYDHQPARIKPLAEVEGTVRDYAVSLAANAAIDGIVKGAGVIVHPENLPTP